MQWFNKSNAFTFNNHYVGPLIYSWFFLCRVNNGPPECTARGINEEKKRKINQTGFIWSKELLDTSSCLQVPLISRKILKECLDPSEIWSMLSRASAEC